MMSLKTDVCDLLDALSRPALLAKPDGYIAKYNKQAEKLFDSSFFVSDGKLLIKDAPARSRMFRSLMLDQDGTSHRILVRRSSGTPMIIDVVPLGSIAQDWLLVLLAEVSTRKPPGIEILQDYFGLTPAESRLAEQIVSGVRLQTAAAALGIGLETARTQLKAVMSKAGVTRQAGLLMLAHDLFG